ncbi:hypothetical protein BGW80DRAFT_292968 [Lactifluus volemus]|nr:hypothetical protein BGW80DRAFT_292968 [Lactifluus volemus]
MYVVCQHLKDILRQYESREHHFECVIRPKELEVLLSCVREVAQQQQLAQGPLLWDDPSPPQEQLQLAHTFTLYHVVELDLCNVIWISELSLSMK